MSIKFSHTAKFNVQKFEKKNSEFGKAVLAKRFVLVYDRTCLKFDLLLYPNGVKCSNSGTVFQGVLLGLKSLNEGFNLKISDKKSIYLSNGSFNLVNEWYPEVEYAGIQNRISTKPVAGSLAELKRKSLLVDNMTHLCVVIELKIAQSAFDIGDLVKSNISSLDYKNIGFCSDLYAKREGVGDNSDFEIICEETGQIFRIHKVVARERSQYFEGLFTSRANCREEKPYVVDWSPQVTEEIIYFIYIDQEMRLNAAPSEEMLEVAQMLGLRKLVAICEKNLLAHITDKNAWDYLAMADTYGMMFLKNKALCVVMEDPNLVEKLFDEEMKREIRKEVAEFAMKPGRAQLIIP